jgi:hypothetical protein
MTSRERDTFDAFAPRERGRFGDKERQRSGPRVTGAADLLDLTLRRGKDNPLSITVADPDKPGGKWISLPKSQIEYVDKGHGIVVVTLPEWLAIDRGLI